MSVLIKGIPLPAPHDHAFHLAEALHENTEVTWHTIAALAKRKDRNPGGYVMRCFGRLNWQEIQDRFKEAKLIDLIALCSEAWKHTERLVDEILREDKDRKSYLSALKSGRAIFLIDDSLIGRMPECRSFEVRSTVILFALQPYFKIHPMPLPQALAWQMHHIAPLPDEPENLHMSPFLSGREKKRVAHETIVHAIFGAQKPEPITLTCAQWCDIGLTLCHDALLPGESQQKMLEKWSKETPVAQSSVETFFKITVVRDLLLKGSCNNDNRQPQTLLTFQRDPSCVLTPQNAYPAWEEVYVFKFLVRNLSSGAQIDLRNSFDRFISQYKALLQDLTNRSKCVFFAKEFNKEYSAYRAAGGETDYQQAAITLKKLSGCIDNLFKDEKGDLPDGMTPLVKFLQSALLSAHLSLLFPLDPTLSNNWFDVYFEMPRLETVIDAWLEPVVKNPVANTCQLNHQALLRRAVFTAEEQAGLLVTCCHHKKQLRRDVLTSSKKPNEENQPLTLEEAYEFLDVFENYMNCSLPAEVIYGILRWQFMTYKGREALNHLLRLRTEISAHIKKPFMAEIVRKISAQEDIICNQEFVLPSTWSQEKIQETHNFVFTLSKILRFSTLLHNGAQEEYVRFIPGLILNDGMGGLQDPLEDWCSLFRGMVRELAPNNRALWVEGCWVKDGRAFQVLVKLILSVAKPLTLTACVELDLVREEIAKDVLLLELLPHLLLVLCDEYIPAGTMWEAQHENEDESLLAHLEDLLHKYSQSHEDDHEVQAMMLELYNRLQNYLLGVDTVRAARIKAVIKFAFKLKKAISEHVIAMCNGEVPCIQEAEKVMYAARGNIWPAAQGFSLVPSAALSPLDVRYGIAREPYQQCLESIVDSILSQDFRQVSFDQACRIPVALANSGELAVDISCELKSQFYGVEGNSQEVFYYSVTMSIHEDKRMTFASRYPNDMSSQNMLEMLFWQLAQLQSACYAVCKP